MNIANILTILRISLVPFFIHSLLTSKNQLTTPLIFFSICMVSDALDGFFARKLKLKNPIGTYLDPIADKILILSSFFVLAYLNLIPIWLFLIILGKDTIIITGWLLIYILTGTYNISVTLLGKISIIFQMLTIFVTLLELKNIQWIFYATTIITVITLVDYCIKGTKKITSTYSK